MAGSSNCLSEMMEAWAVDIVTLLAAAPNPYSDDTHVNPTRRASNKGSFKPDGI